MSFSQELRNGANPIHTDMQNHVPRALTIAGSDSGGGAGIQADLKTMHQFGVYGASVLTALTAQNTLGVHGVLEVNPDFVAEQLRAVLNDIGADAVKTGMLANAAIVHVVADTLKDYPCPHLVVDPVMVAKGGAQLIDHASVHTLCKDIVPLAQIITPNIPEAGVLCGFSIETWADCHRAVEIIAAMGAQTVILKGGHMPQSLVQSAEWLAKTSGGSAVIDMVYSKGQYTYFLTPRIATQKTHGTGCTFSAAITSLLARGANMLDAVATAKTFIFQAIANATEWDIGQGHGPTDHSASYLEHSGIEATGVYLLNDSAWMRIA